MEKMLQWFQFNQGRVRANYSLTDEENDIRTGKDVDINDTAIVNKAKALAEEIATFLQVNKYEAE